MGVGYVFGCAMFADISHAYLQNIVNLYNTS